MTYVEEMTYSITIKSMLSVAERLMGNSQKHSDIWWYCKGMVETLESVIKEFDDLVVHPEEVESA